MGENKLILPKKYEIYDITPEKYHKYAGREKISYSQYNSFKDPLYKGDYIVQYFLGVKLDSGIFADFGSACGGFFEDGVTVDTNWLSESDVEVLKRVPRPEGALYESEIVIDCGDFVLQGFSDQEFENSNMLVILDMKTGNVDSKVEFYGSTEYQQTTLYAYCREQEGYNIGYSGVILLGRKGNGRPGHPLRLSGVIERIPTPYTRERAEKALEKVKKVAEEISELYKVFLKVNV